MKIAKAEVCRYKKPIIQSNGVIYSGRNIPKDFCDLKIFVPLHVMRVQQNAGIPKRAGSVPARAFWRFHIIVRINSTAAVKLIKSNIRFDIESAFLSLIIPDFTTAI